MLPSVTFCFNLFLMMDITASAKILGIFTIDAFSHFNINNAIMETLAMGGHEVTVISTLKPKNPLANITYIRVKKEIPSNVSVWTTVEFNKFTWWQLSETFTQIFEHDCDRFMATKEVQDLLASKTRMFDLLIVELVPFCECYMSVAWRQEIPIIGTFSVDIRAFSAAILGNPYHPSIIPHYYSTYTSRMSFFERLSNTIETMYWKYIEQNTIIPASEKCFHKYFSETDLKMADISLLFLNNHASLFPLPYVPGIVETGGIHMKTPQTLPKHLDEFIRGAEHGVILFSLGSIIGSKDLSSKAKQIFQKVFAQIPQRIIWKNEEHVEGISGNVLISKWVPQQDILAQENVVLFISHAGKSSTLEAIHSGTPILAVPLWVDQLSNSGNIRDLGVGKVLDLDTLTEAVLLSSIQEVLQEKSYKDEVTKLSRAFKNRPISAKQAVLYWTEYVLRHNGTSHLQTAATYLPFYQYLLLDVILFMIIPSTLILVFMFYFIKKTYNLIFTYGKNEKMS